MSEVGRFPARITFWQIMPSIHQSAQIRSLIDRGFEVTVVVEGGIDPERAALGWTLPDFGTAQLVISPSQEQINAIAGMHTRETIHLIGGLRGYRLGKSAFAACMRAKARMGLLSEGGNPLGLGGAARRFLYLAQRIKYGRDIDFVLTMGQNGVHWYRQSGWPRDKIFPYAYITTREQRSELTHLPDSGKATIELLYVGQLIHRKGVDILLRALQRVIQSNWCLAIAGTGPLQAEYIRMCRELGLAERVEFLGVLPNDAVKERIARADLLVLPSRFDGWGAVVNEALMCGVPVICSDQCGASDLLQADWRGEVFPSQSVPVLTKLLEKRINFGRTTRELRTEISTWSRCIAGECVAEYLCRIFGHVYHGESRPIPPWDEQ